MIKASFKLVLSKRNNFIAGFHTISLNCLSKEGLDKLKASCKVLNIQPCNKDETSANLLKLLPKYNSFLLKKSILIADADTRFDIAFSQKFVGAILPVVSIQDLRDLRAILATAHYRTLFELDKAILDKVVLRCIALGDVMEGLQWMMLAEDVHNFHLSPSSYDAVLQAAIFSNTWDVLHYLLQDMQRRAQALAPHMLELIVRESCKQPFMRWRLVQKLLLDSAATVDEKVMSLALQTLTSAHQHKAACSLYRTHARSLDMMNNAAHDADILFRTTQMAMQSQDFGLMQEVLHNYCSANCDAVSRGVSEQEEWLVRYVDQLLNSPDAPLSSGPAVGCVVGWLLAYGKTDSAVVVWNAHMASIKHYTAESLEDEDQRVHNTVGIVVTQIARLGSVHTCGQTQLAATAKFLRAVLMSTGESGSCIPEVVDVQLSNELIANSLVSLFTQVQDVDAVSITLTKSLAQGFLVSEDLMNDSLRLFQKHEDHELVLELFDMYLGLKDPRHSAQPQTAKKKTGTRSRRKASEGDHFTLGSAFASELFTVAMHSLAAKNDFAGMINILTDVIPSRGFIPKVSAYAMAMYTLSKHDMNLEVNSLYAQSQELYSNVLQAKKRGERTVPLGYGVGCISLADIALRSCAKGYLGVAALEIFQALDTVHRRGITILKPSDAGTFAELVIMALATPDYVVIIPQFLDSMRGIEASIVVPDRVLVSALAAAVAVGSDPVATEVARLIENTHRKSLDSVVTLSGLLGVLDNSFGVRDSGAVISFVQSCEALRTLNSL